MGVGVDEDLRTGRGLDGEICRGACALREDGLAHAKEGDTMFDDPGSVAQIAVRPIDLEGAMTGAREECTGEWVFIEP